MSTVLLIAAVVFVSCLSAQGQAVAVDNRPGAGGTTGSELVARAAPDGYTIIIVASTYAATCAYSPPPYDPIAGIQPIILIGTTGLLMTVHPSAPAKNVRELIDHAKANPGRLNYASVGAGSVPHFAQELFRLETGINIVRVPYKGASPALIALVGGEVQLTTLSMVAVLPHIKAGRLRALAITTPARSSVMPDLPAIGETVPGFEVVHWYGIWGPKGMPKPIVARWNQDVSKVLRTDEMKSRTRAEGLETAGGPPEEFGNLIRRDVEKWRKMAHLFSDAMNAEQQQRFIPQFVADPEATAAIAITEAGAGSDHQGFYDSPDIDFKTMAVRDGDHYVINGTFHMISGFQRSRDRHHASNCACGNGWLTR